MTIHASVLAICGGLKKTNFSTGYCQLYGDASGGTFRICKDYDTHTVSSWVLDDYYKAITNNDLIGVFCWSREKDRTDTLEGCEAGANNATRAGGGHKDCVRYM